MEVGSENPETAQRAERVLRMAGPFANLDKLVMDYGALPDGTRKKRMADAYFRLTGEEAELRLVRLMD